MTRDQWPPGGRDGEGGANPADVEKVATQPPHPQNTAPAPPRQCSADPRLWQRRRAASRRLAPLPCGCRDPWPCRCDQPPLTDRMVDAYRDTVLHLRHCGLLAAPNVPAMQALWRRSPEDRRLASEIAERWELAG